MKKIKYNKNGNSPELQRALDNDTRPCISPIYYSVEYNNGELSFGISNAKCNKSEEEFKQRIMKSFPTTDVHIYENKSKYDEAVKKWIDKELNRDDD